ncbi:MAG TPA: HAMP domain-containing sensor histidine kinase [Mycobacteriales bacterium]|jgi:signal transduction histidine kinase|nr:HAMP domain-containing sensor histidine kinase [Mycobacteriales bacterium]
MRTPSLRLRVVVAVLGLMTVALVGLGLLVNAVLAARLHADLRDRLTERAGFAQLLAGRGYTDQDLADRLTGQGITAVVRDGSAEVYGRNFPPFGGGGGRPGPRPPRPGTDTSAVAVTTQNGVLTATLPLTPGTLTLSADDGEIVHTLGQLRTVEWIAGAGMLAVTGLLLTKVVSGALAPLTRMAAVAGRIAAGSRGERLRPTRAGTDLGRTAVALDGMLDALEASELRMRAFVADASHDLRTPVAGVIATADSLLRDDPGRAERERRLVAMVREARRAGRLVDDLLLMARLDGTDPAAELRRQPVDLTALAADVAGSQRLLGADVRTWAAGPAPVTGDAEQLTRVLTNLADNARREGTHVLLSVRREAGQVWVEVTDDGPGVPPADRDRVFERFVRLETGPGGNGLGLPIARAVARAHGGDLTCEDAAAGARFVLRIPAPEGSLVLPPVG